MFTFDKYHKCYYNASHHRAHTQRRVYKRARDAEHGTIFANENGIYYEFMIWRAVYVDSNTKYRNINAETHTHTHTAHVSIPCEHGTMAQQLIRILSPSRELMGFLFQYGYNTASICPYAEYWNNSLGEGMNLEAALRVTRLPCVCWLKQIFSITMESRTNLP